MKITQEVLKQMLRYDPETGVFIWIQAGGRRRDLDGTVAGTPNKPGYLRICLFQKGYMAHRLAWLYMTGEMPLALVDHINMVKGDNRWTNLRAATKAQNGVNSISRCASGVKGAYWQSQSKVWYSKYKNAYLGTFKTPEEANAAYIRAASAEFPEFARG